MQRSDFRRQWFLWNAVSWLVGFTLFSPIAHGVTGGHGPDLTPAQYTAHTIGLVVAAVIVASAQWRVLKRFVPVSWSRVLIAPVVFSVAFWIGSYLYFDGPDTDILLGFLALGSVVWIGNIPAKGHRMATVLAILSFPLASFLVELCLIGIVTLLRFEPALQTSEIQHGIFWITIGGLSGVLGGWLSGLALSRMIAHAPTQGIQSTAHI